MRIFFVLVLFPILAVCDINSIIDKYLPDAFVAVQVTDLERNKEQLSVNTNKYFVPASLAKIFTAKAALDLLGSNYRYTTKILWKPELLKKSVYRGDLRIVTSGDPSLTSKDLELLVKVLQEKGVKHIIGNIVISNDPTKSYPMGWTNDSLAWSYSPLVGNNIINGNSVTVKVKPNKNLNTKPIVVNNNKHISIINQIRSMDKPYTDKHCPVFVNASTNNNYILSGCLPAMRHETKLNLSVADPNALLRSTLSNSLKNYGIAFKGKYTSKTKYKHFILLKEHRSPDLSHLVSKMLQKSDNLISEALLKTLGEKKYASNSFQSGITVVKEYLADLGLNTEDINLFDGSGLSRYNQVRAKIFNDFWLKSGHDGFVNKLSAPGSNGTLEHRFKGQSFREYLLAKTGSMLGISGITGILTNKKSKKLAVTIIANNVTDQKTAKLMEQELLDYIYHR